MIDKDRLLREAEELKRSAESIKNLDESVERRSNSGKRQNMVEEIKKVQARYLNTSSAKVAWQSGTLHNELIKSVNGRLFPDQSSIFVYQMDYNGTPNWDTASERRLLATECFQRIESLKKVILEGKLDHLLSSPAEVLIHGVMGYEGELLAVLGINPKLGETYRRITEPSIDVPMGKEADNWKTFAEMMCGRGEQENLAKTRQEFSSAFQNLPKTLLSNANKPSSAPKRARAKLIGYRVKEGNQKVKNPPISDQNQSSEIPMGIPVFHTRTSGVTEIPIGTPVQDVYLDNLEVETGIPIDNIVGITGFTLNDEIASYMGVAKETRGVLVINVFPNSIAEKAGLRAARARLEEGKVISACGLSMCLGFRIYFF